MTSWMEVSVLVKERNSLVAMMKDISVDKKCPAHELAEWAMLLAIFYN